MMTYEEANRRFPHRLTNEDLLEIARSRSEDLAVWWTQLEWFRQLDEAQKRVAACRSSS